MCYFILNLFFLIKNPGNIFNQPERFGEGISTYGSRDAHLYVKMAWQIINEGVYGYNNENSNAYVTPGQPFYIVFLIKLSILFKTNHVMVIKLSNMFLNIGILTLIYLISIKLFNKKNIGIVAILLYATHITPLHMFRTSLTEIPTIFLLMLNIYIFLHAIEKKSWKLHILFGLMSSVMLMFRATPAPLLLLAWGIVVYKEGIKEATKIGFIWCIGPIIVFTPWVIRNLQLFGEMYLFSSHAGGPLLAGTNAFQREDFGLIYKQAIESGLSEKEFALKRLKEEFLKDIPYYFSWFTMGKTMWLFIGPGGAPDGLGPLNHYISNSMLLFFKLQNIFVSFSALVFAYILRKQKTVKVLSYFVFIYILFSNFFLTLPRYGFIIYPILTIIVGYYVCYVYEKAVKKRKMC